MQNDDTTTANETTIGWAQLLPVRSSGAGDGDASGSQDDNAGTAQDANTDGSKDSTDDAGKGGQSQDDGSTGGDGNDGSKPEKTAAERKLERENQRLRRERNEAKDALDEQRRNELSEAERAKEDAERAKAEAAEAKAEALRLRTESAVTAEASKLKFHSPDDALALLPKDAVTIGDDGKVDTTSVATALKALAEAKPHLVNRSGGDSGGAFGGTKGRQGEANAESEADRRVRLGLARPTSRHRVAFNGGGVVRPSGQ